MSDLATMIAEAARRLTERATDPIALSATMTEAGLLRPFTATDNGTSWADVAPAIRALGRNAPFTSLADSIAADSFASRLDIDDTLPLCLSSDRLNASTGGAVTGTCRSLSFLSPDAIVLTVVATDSGDRIAALAVADGETWESVSISGERRATVAFENSSPIALSDTNGSDAGLLAGGLTRALLVAGAIEKVLSMTMEHCLTRKQFGRPLTAFQAIQHQLATLASESAAARAIADLAARRIDSDAAAMTVAAARVRTAAAARRAIDISHQCHGAIGFTEEYPLHVYTRALMAWRGEFGTERFWARRLGTAVGTSGQDIWPLLVSTAGERDDA